MRFTYTVEVELQRTEGKFATRDEIAEQLLEAIEGADPGSIDSVGPDSSSSYEVVDWSVTEQEQPKRSRRKKTGTCPTCNGHERYCETCGGFNAAKR